MERTKFETYAGFAIRACKLVRGTNAILACRKRIFSMFLCSTASENTKKEALSIAKKRNVPLAEVKGVTLENAVHKENCKLVAFLDKKLSEAAWTHMDENFTILNEIQTERNTIGGVLI